MALAFAGRTHQIAQTALGWLVLPNFFQGLSILDLFWEANYIINHVHLSTSQIIQTPLQHQRNRSSVVKAVACPSFLPWQKPWLRHWCHSLRKVRPAQSLKTSAVVKLPNDDPTCPIYLTGSERVPGCPRKQNNHIKKCWIWLNHSSWFPQHESNNSQHVVVTLPEQNKQKWWCTASTFRNQGCKGWIIFKSPALRRSFHGLNTA